MSALDAVLGYLLAARLAFSLLNALLPAHRIRVGRAALGIEKIDPK